MALSDLLKELDTETKTVTSPQFSFNVTNTKFLPNINDSALTFENFDQKTKGVKYIETCVLYVDIRKSTKLSFQHKPQTLAKLYSSFVRGVIKCGRFYSGHVRGIIGDRVMILFDQEKCFENAVNSAILINTFVRYVLNQNFKYNDISCGIGLDYGPMFVTKIGSIKRGSQRSDYRSLVWLGTPANIASKLTDLANKSISRDVIAVANQIPYSTDWKWGNQEIAKFFDGIDMVYEPGIIARFKDPTLKSFFLSSVSKEYKSILMTERIFHGFKKACPEDTTIKNKLWNPKSVSIDGYNGSAYEGSVIFTCGKEL